MNNNKIFKKRKHVSKLLAVVIVISILAVVSIFSINTFAANNSTLSVSKDRVTIPFNGASQFVNASQISDEATINVTKQAEWRSNNEKVALAFDGRIFATGKGHTEVTVTFGGMTEKILVDVVGQKDIKSEIKSKIKSIQYNTAYAIQPTVDRSKILEDCRRMNEFEWTPTKNLTGWKGRITYKKGEKVVGLPYSQTVDKNQVDEVGFASALNKSDFYTPFYGKKGDITYPMPRYGNDCSGFVSLAWDISRRNTDGLIKGIKDGTFKKIGYYNPDSPSYDDILQSYRSLDAGDAVVSKSDVHTFIIAINYPNNPTPYCVCYEQAQFTTKMSYWYYDQLANLEYMSLGKK